MLGSSTDKVSHQIKSLRVTLLAIARAKGKV